MINIQFLTNGNLEMSIPDKRTRKRVKDMGNLNTLATEQRFVKHYLEPLGYKEIKPEDCGALTSATLITDGKDVWGDMNYQVYAFLRELVDGNTVTWQKG
jgi:hypothetical protein